MLSRLSTALVAAFTLLAAASAQATDLTLFKTIVDSEGDEIFELAPLDEFQYRLRVVDSGEGVLGVNVHLTDNVPSLVNILGVSTDFGSCDVQGQAVTCDLSGIADGATVTVTINATLSGIAALDEEITNTAQVTASNEINPSDNQDAVSFIVASETVVDDGGGGCALQVRSTRSHAWPALRGLLRSFE